MAGVQPLNLEVVSDRYAGQMAARQKEITVLMAVIHDRRITEEETPAVIIAVEHLYLNAQNDRALYLDLRRVLRDWLMSLRGLRFGFAPDMGTRVAEEERLIAALEQEIVEAARPNNVFAFRRRAKREQPGTA